MAEALGGYRFLPAQLAERLRGVDISVHRPMDGAHQGLHKSSAFGSSVEFAEYREYMPGDPIQRIDWPVYARSDRYVIRQYHEDVSIRCTILLDTSESMGYQEDGMLSKMDYACYLAAGMMYLMVQQGDMVSLITFGEKVGDYYEPTSSFRGLRPMLRGLEAVAPKGKSDIEGAMHESAELIPGKALVVVISDFLEGPSGILRGVHHFNHQGKELTLFHVLDPAELQLPQSGLVEVAALEGGGKLSIDLGEVREAYLGQVRGYLDELRDGCMSVRAGYLPARTDREVFEVLLDRSRLI